MQTAIPTKSGSSPSARHSLFPSGQLVPFILVTALFFLWGIPKVLTPWMGLIAEKAHGIAAAYVIPQISSMVIAFYSFVVGKRAPATS